MIGGVCGGLGEYFEIDPVIFRIIFLVLIFLAGGGFLLYVILWIIVPLDTITYNKGYSTPPPKANFTKESDDIHYEEMDEKSFNSNVDKSKNAKKKNKQGYIGAIIIIIIGVILLFNNLFGCYNLRKWWPLLIIIIGVLLLIPNISKGVNKKSKNIDKNSNVEDVKIESENESEFESENE